MSDPVFLQAAGRRAEISRRLQELRLEARELEKEIADLNKFITMYRKLRGGTSDEQPIQDEFTQPVYVPVITPAFKTPVNPPREKVGDLVEMIIRERGRPIGRTELFAEVKKRGMTIYGKDPEMVFSTMLWRMQDRFIRLPKRGYWLVKEPCPAVDYVPPRAATMEDIFGD